MSNKEKFNNIEKTLRNELIGQDNFVLELCNYFEKKIDNDNKGNIFLLGGKDTGKKSAIELLVNELNKEGLFKNNIIDEIDLNTYNFNLGYNAFITDLYNVLNSDSELVIFKDFNKASDEILKMLSNLYPKTCLMLNGSYVIRNEFLVEAEKEELGSIDNFICHEKFFVFTSNEDGIQLNKLFNDEFINRAFVLYTEELSTEDREKVVAREFNKAIDSLGEFKIDFIFNQDENKYKNLISFLNSNYKSDSSLRLREYIAYEIYKPLKNFILSEEIKEGHSIILYLENEEIYCETEKGTFKLSKYQTATLEEVKYKLKSIIGMKQLKDFMNSIENNYKVQKIREKLGLKTSKMSLNMIFAGNAGTGKTNAARVTFEYLNALGLLKKGIFKEVSKADFVTENIEEAAGRTIEIIESAIGGVLFIDEAYSLCENEDDKMGKEIVNALLKGIEDNREDLIVILAGYEKDMDRFLEFNSGLKSRFPNTIVFEDYNPNEMYEIAVNIAKSKGYRISTDVKDELIELFVRNQTLEKNDLGNARFVRNVVDNAILDASKEYMSNSSKEIDLLERNNFNFKANSKFNLEEKLSEIIGLEEVKNFLRNQYKIVIAQEKRRAAGIDIKIDQNLNMVFAGNPGTGKTSIARIVAEMLNSMGALKVGQLIETDRSSFVSEVPGQTSKKTIAKFKEAIGGVLFIDEAYTLAADEIGREAIETLLKLIEDYRGEVIVILAGYEKDMEDFFAVNIGLKSRFPLWTTFEDYNPEELLSMAIKIIKSKGFEVSELAYKELKKSFKDIYENLDSQSGNGRMVRNYVENLIRNQSIRIAENDISVYEMNLITEKDIEKINVSEYDTDFDIEENIKSIVGNENIKEFLRQQYKIIKIEEKRAKKGLNTYIDMMQNIVFTGSDGTGKRLSLDIFANMLSSMGVLDNSSVLEIGVSKIISSYKSGKSLSEVVKNVRGRVIFLKRADLIIEEENDKEIISNLVNFIEETGKRNIIVISGEKEKLTKLMKRNVELNYKFPLWLNFKDFSSDNLMEMALNKIADKELELSEGAREVLDKVIKEIYTNVRVSNGFVIKTYVDILAKTQSVRVYEENCFDRSEINKLTKKDIIESKKEFLKNLI